MRFFEGPSPFVIEKTAKNQILVPKISFWRFSQKVSILGYMLRRNINMNMDIANNLHYQKSLEDNEGPKYIISGTL
jgi:hypothetical protein